MLSEIEFKDVKHIVLDKPFETVIMNRNTKGGWNVVMVPRKFSISEMSYHTYNSDDEAYEFYRARMDSFGFRRFSVLTE